MKTQERVICFCGSPASIKSNSLLYNGKEYGNGRAWICDRFPECRGAVGTHPDGKPLGTIADQETKNLRKEVHAMFDPIWKNDTSRSRGKSRGYAYGYLARIMDMDIRNCHIGEFTKEDCEKALRRMKEEPFVERKPTPLEVEL